MTRSYEYGVSHWSASQTAGVDARPTVWHDNYIPIHHVNYNVNPQADHHSVT